MSGTEKSFLERNAPIFIILAVLMIIIAIASSNDAEGAEIDKKTDEIIQKE